MDSPFSLGALFIDFENIYYFIKSRAPESVDASDASIATLRNIRERLRSEGVQCIVQHAYADFERIAGTPQGDLYLIGIETHNVLGTDHKNAADMRLCIDAMETLYTRPEIGHVVFVAGDRDYIPVVQHLRKHAKSVLVVAFKGSVSGDLLQVAEENNFVDAATALPPGVVLAEAPRATLAPPPVVRNGSTVLQKAVVPVSRPPAFGSVIALDSEDEYQAIEIMFEHFADKPEIWLTPYLHRQRAAMSHLAEYERRALLNALVGKGAISIEKRPGEQAEFSVIVLNHNHPSVRELNPG